MGSCYRFKSLDITSSNKPKNAHLITDTSDEYIYMIDSTDETLLLKSENNGTSWSTIKDCNRPLQAMWHDRTNNNLWIVEFDNLGLFYDPICIVYKVNLSNDSVSTEATYDFSDATYDKLAVYDIFLLGSTYYIVVVYRLIAGSQVKVSIWEVDTDLDTLSEIDNLNASDYQKLISFVTVYDSNAYFMYYNYLMSFDGASITNEKDISGYDIGDDRDRQSIASDGKGYLYFTPTKAGAYNLIIYDITGSSYEEESEYNVVVMLDRNCSSTFPNEYEKGFGVSNEITYQIIPRRGRLIQLQNCSELTDNNIIAITDNFFMNDDGDMFKWTEIFALDYISDIEITDGILPYEAYCIFICHPNYESYFNRGDSLKIYDKNDVLCFWGRIMDKSRNKKGLYTFGVDAFKNEIFDITATVSFSGDDTDTKQKYLIDNYLKFCYYTE